MTSRPVLDRPPVNSRLIKMSNRTQFSAQGFGLWLCARDARSRNGRLRSRKTGLGMTGRTTLALVLTAAMPRAVTYAQSAFQGPGQRICSRVASSTMASSTASRLLLSKQHHDQTSARFPAMSPGRPWVWPDRRRRWWRASWSAPCNRQRGPFTRRWWISPAWFTGFRRHKGACNDCIQDTGGRVAVAAGGFPVRQPVRGRGEAGAGGVPARLARGGASEPCLYRDIAGRRPAGHAPSYAPACARPARANGENPGRARRSRTCRTDRHWLKWRPRRRW